MTKVMLRSLFCFLALTAAAVAAPINLGFETGDLTGWGSLGDVSNVTSHTGAESEEEATAAEGSRFALLLAGIRDVEEVEDALGLAPLTIRGLMPHATFGSALWRDLALTAGQTVRLATWFGAEERSPGSDDFAFWSVSDLAGHQQAAVIASVSSGASVVHQTGWRPFSFTAPADGTYRIGFGVFDEGNAMYSSRLGVDAVPEPGTFALLGLGIGALLLRRRFRRA